jgi:hypothetical protein
MDLTQAPIMSNDVDSRLSGPAATAFTRWSRGFSSRVQWCRQRAGLLLAAARGARDGEGRADDARDRHASSRRLTRAEEINRLPWDEQLQVAQAASDEAKAKHGRRAS